MDTRISRHYNEWTPAKGVEIEFTAVGRGCAFTVLAVSGRADGTPLEVSKIPVRSNLRGTLFGDDAIEALDIRFGEQHLIDLRPGVLLTFPIDRVDNVTIVYTVIYVSLMQPQYRACVPIHPPQ